MTRPRLPEVASALTAARWTGLAALLAGLAALVVRGPLAGLSAAGGCAVTSAFFLLGVLGLSTILVAAPGLAVVGAYAVYGTQLMILMLVVVLARDYLSVDRPAFVFGAVTGTMVWQVAHSIAFLRARVPLYTPTAPKEEP